MCALIEQYKAIKAKYPDAILLFRVGDYYETFDDDAKVVSQKTGVILTASSHNQANEIAGFPFQLLDYHLRTLVKAGCRVAICAQLEDPKTAKGMVKRGVTAYLKP